MSTVVSGFLNLYKPIGWTSHDCVARVRRLVGIKKVGHGGTLDPAASGVLPIALGRATRLLSFLPSDKVYRAVIRFGLTTTTDDLEGERVTAQPCPDLTETAAIAPRQQFLGTQQQVPPKYSAVQVQGKRLYELARQGIAVPVPVRTVRIDALEPRHWQAGEFPELTIDVTCGAGTYIRSLARDWGAALGVGATLAALVRTRSGAFDQQHSLTLADLEAQLEAGTFQPIPPEAVLGHLPALTLAEDEAKRWRQGQMLLMRDRDRPVAHSLADGCCIFDAQQQFLGISVIEPVPSDDPAAPALQLRPKMVFVPYG